MDDFFSDSDGEKAVEELLSQAMDATVLEQVAAINCAGFTNSDLPSHLETRFRKLKSFPASTGKPTSLSSKSFNVSHAAGLKKNDSANEAKSSEPKIEEKGLKLPSNCSTKCPEEQNCVSPSNSGSFSPFKKNPRGKMEKKVKKSPSSSSWEGFSSRSVSPPAKSGCFLCSPKKVSRKKNKGNRGLDLGLAWGKDDELLSDLSNFSVNNQRKIMKKAMEEEDKICREAEKIVKWAKHASARLEISRIEDELSDDENAKYH